MNAFRIWIAVLTGIFWIGCIGFSNAADMRAVSQKANDDYHQALMESKKQKRKIFKNRKQLKMAISDMEESLKSLESDIRSMKTEYLELGNKQEELTGKLNQAEMDMKGYAGVIRQTARDISSIIFKSHFSAQVPERVDILKSIQDPDQFPGIEAVKGLTGLILEEMMKTGQVETFQGNYLDRDGKMKDGTLLTIGPFSAVYNTSDETGFLRYSEAYQRFTALSTLPPWNMQRNLETYIKGDTDAVYFDPSGGAALKRISHRSTLTGKIKKGGLLVWPILAIGGFALLIVMERLIFLQRVHANADRLMKKFNQLAAKADWDGCRKLLAPKKGRPVYNVLMAGFKAVDQSRENLENILQEAILKELPRLERFLPALKVMAAVSPLIGLLGTVTGMIGTFHVITLYGTGDPRLMSGGISEALVTTMLGLGVAIPVMLFHAFLRRRIEHIVGDMEEKAVALSNIICGRCRIGDAASDLPVNRPYGGNYGMVC